MRATILYPRASRYKINSDLAGQRGITLVEVDADERAVKDLTQQLQARSMLPWLPGLDCQIAGNKVRAHFVDDFTRATGIRFDWHVQALSSGFGVFGFYAGIDQLSGAGRLRGSRPRFLGVQQAAVAPYYADLHGRPTRGHGDVIEPTLFRTCPGTGLITRMRAICSDSGGTVIAVDSVHYAERERETLDLLAGAELRPTVRAHHEGGERLLERAGVIATVGVLDAVHSGCIEPGSDVLVAITGGLAPRTDALYVPSVTLAPVDADHLGEVAELLTCTAQQKRPRRASAPRATRQRGGTSS